MDVPVLVVIEDIIITQVAVRVCVCEGVCMLGVRVCVCEGVCMLGVRVYVHVCV